MIVCDGFIGNVALKVSEGLVEMVYKMLRESLEATITRKIGYVLSRTAFKEFKKRVDYSEYGGAPLLGVKGVCIITHGRSNANAIKNAIRVAAEFAEGKINERIEAELANGHMAGVTVGRQGGLICCAHSWPASFYWRPSRAPRKIRCNGRSTFDSKSAAPGSHVLAKFTGTIQRALARLFHDHAAGRPESHHREHRRQSSRRRLQDLSGQARPQARPQLRHRHRNIFRSVSCFCSTSS